MATFLSLGWLLSAFVLFLYSFTQIDLNLTLTRIPFWQEIQRNFQYVGYFNRPLSLAIYLGILFLLFGFYLAILEGTRRKWFSSRELWRLILITTLILCFAYNAFSYDLFNYVFDAKIVTFYHQSPYQYRAMDFPNDPMLGFMHWTHRYFPYGPLWLVVTVPLSFIGWQKLVPTMLLIRGLAIISYLGGCWLIERILAKTNSKTSLVGLSAFAFNPLVIIEVLVSAHNDILMMTLGLAAFWLLLRRKAFFGWLALGLSAGVKFATALLAPALLLVSFLQWQKKKIDWERIWQLSFFLMMAAVLAAIKRDELKPWYLLYPLPFMALASRSKWLFWPTIGLSLGVLLHYAPFLYLGNWDPPVPEVKLKLTLLFLTAGVIIYLLGLAKERIIDKKAQI